MNIRYLLLDTKTGKYGILKGKRPAVRKWLVDGEDFQFIQGEVMTSMEVEMI